MTAYGDHEPQDRVPHRPVPHDPNAPMPVIRPDGTIERATPATHPEPATSATVLPPESTLVAVLGDRRREGPWHLGQTLTAVGVLGDVVLDLRQAVFAERSCTIRVLSLMGNVKIYTPPHIEVQMRGLNILGDEKHRDLSESGASGAPRPTPTHTVILQSTLLLGDVSVTVLDPGQPKPSVLKNLAKKLKG